MVGAPILYEMSQVKSDCLQYWRGLSAPSRARVLDYLHAPPMTMMVLQDNRLILKIGGGSPLVVVGFGYCRGHNTGTCVTSGQYEQLVVFERLVGWNCRRRQSL